MWGMGHKFGDKLHFTFPKAIGFPNTCQHLFLPSLLPQCVCTVAVGVGGGVGGGAVTWQPSPGLGGGGGAAFPGGGEDKGEGVMN